MKKKQGKLYISLINVGRLMCREECTLDAICRMVDTFNLDSNKLLDQVWPAYTKFQGGTEDVDLVINYRDVKKAPFRVGPWPTGLNPAPREEEKHYYVTLTAYAGKCVCGKRLNFEPISNAEKFHMDRHISEVMSNADSFDNPYPQRISADDYRNLYMRPRPRPVLNMAIMESLNMGLANAHRMPVGVVRDRTIDFYIREIADYVKG